MKKFIISVLICCLELALFASGDGTLDTATFNPPNGFEYNPPASQSIAAAVQTDGKIVAVGQSTVTSTNLTVRYNTDGSIDGSFINNSVTDFFVNDVIIQPDGKILIVGSDLTTFTHVILVRYLPNGDFDPSFGTNGIVDVPNIGFANSVILQSDSKIVVVGGDETFNFVKAFRFLPNGAPDPSFMQPVTPPSDTGQGAFGIVIQPDGKILTSSSSISNQLQVIRYNADGSLDTTFNGTGIATVPTGVVPIAYGAGVLLQPSTDPAQTNGKIIVAGEGITAAGIIFVARYNSSDGSLDTSFGTGGVSTIPNRIGVNGLVLQADSKIITAGAQTAIAPTTFQVARLTQDGALDTTWNATGPVPGFTSEPNGFANGSTIQQDGKIIAVGSDGANTNFAIARYNSSPVFTPTAIITPASGSQLTPGAINFSGTAQNPAILFLLIDGVIVAGTQTINADNIWTIPLTFLTPGTHTAQAISNYQDKKLNIASEIITFTIGGSGIVAQKSDNLNGAAVNRGELINYTITITNQGSTAFDAIAVTDTLPPCVRFITASASNGVPLFFNNGVVTGQIGTIAAGQTVTITITVQVGITSLPALINRALITGTNVTDINLVTQTPIASITANIANAIASKYCMRCP